MGAKYTLFTDDFALVAATENIPLRINAGAARAVILREVTITDKLAGSTDEGIRFRVMTGDTNTTGTTTTPTPLGSASASAASGELVGCAASTTPAEKYNNACPAGGAIIKRFDDDEGIGGAASTGIYISLLAAQARSSGIVHVTAIFEEV